MKFNVIYNRIIKTYDKSLRCVESALGSKGAEYKSFDISEMENWGDFTFVIGGDGTFLKAARFYANYQTPVLGINMGRLGFLAQVGENEINEVIDAVLDGKYITQDRLLLEANGNLALNDFVIKGSNPARTSKLFLEINGKPVCDYIADGLIISTPTGSTAYGLSAGGPVLHPMLDAIAIVPICPHTLNARPLVIPPSENICVCTDEDSLYMAIDGFDAKDYINKINIKTSDKKAKLAFIKKEGFYKILRNKLHWGVSPTNL